MAVRVIGDGNDPIAKRRAPMTCPICRKPTTEAYRPFCSKRCADVDLARWLTGAYAIPAEDAEIPDSDADGAPPTGQKPH